MPPPQMQDTSVPNQSQDPVPQADPNQTGLTQDESAAALGFITSLSENMHLASQPMPAAENAPAEGPLTPDVQSEVDGLKKQVEELQKQVDKKPKDDLSEIRKMVEDALAEDDTKENE